MKPTLIIDFNGALLSPRPFNHVHETWFYTMSILLKDPSINKYANTENYFEKVHEIMHRYLGDVSEKTRIKFARNLYSLSLISEIQKEDLSTDFVEFLNKLKNKYEIALITSAPNSSVSPILEKLKLNELFSTIIKSEDDTKPNKEELLNNFLKKEKNCTYIGLGDKHLLFCKNQGIKTISVNWNAKSTNKGDFDVNTVNELKNIL